MCNCAISVCLSCARGVRKESACIDFDEAKKVNNYKDIYEAEWMLEHVKEKPDRLRVDVRFVFCPECKHDDKPGFVPNVKKLSKVAEMITRDCLGQFRFMLPNQKIISQWRKTEFGKTDLDKYMTTDAETDDGDYEEETGSESEGENENKVA